MLFHWWASRCAYNFTLSLYSDCSRRWVSKAATSMMFLLISDNNNNESLRTLSLYKRLWMFNNQTFSVAIRNLTNLFPERCDWEPSAHPASEVNLHNRWCHLHWSSWFEDCLRCFSFVDLSTKLCALKVVRPEEKFNQIYDRNKISSSNSQLLCYPRDSLSSKLQLFEKHFSRYPLQNWVKDFETY